MTTEFGGKIHLQQSDYTVRTASWVLNKWLPLLSHLSDSVSLRFDRDKLRLSLHGESEHRGDAYERGHLVAILGVTNALLGVLPLMFIGDLQPVTPQWLLPVMLIPIVCSALFAVVNLKGSLQMIDQLQVLDHTEAPRDTDDLDAAKQAFTNGEITEAEFDRRVDRVLEAETEARLE